MKSSTRFLIAVVSFCMLLTCGCATHDIKATQYTPQNTVVAQGSVAVGDFTYVGNRNYNPPRQDSIDSRNILYNFNIDADVSSYVKNATVLELHKSGVATKQDGRYVLLGHVSELSIEFGQTWRYRIKYTITDKLTGLVSFCESFQEYDTFVENDSVTSGTLDKLIVSSYSKLMNTADVRVILKKSLDAEARP